MPPVAPAVRFAGSFGLIPSVRDSIQFFKRNPLLVKLDCKQEEKNELIAAGKLHQNMRTREVTMTTAHNLFKAFGARFVKDGHYVTDDYYEELARVQGKTPEQSADVPRYDPELDTGTLAKPKLPGMTAAGTPINSKPFVFSAAPSGTQSTMTYGSAGVRPFGKTWQREHHQRSKRVYADLTPRSWMLRYALDVAKTNDAIARWRGDTTLRVDLGTDEFEPRPIAPNPGVKTEQMDDAAMAIDTPPASNALDTLVRRPRSPVHGVFESHTNVPHVRRATQPTSARLEYVSPLPLLGQGASQLLARYEPALSSISGLDVDALERAAAARAGVCSIEHRIVVEPASALAADEAMRWSPAEGFDFGVRAAVAEL